MNNFDFGNGNNGGSLMNPGGSLMGGMPAPMPMPMPGQSAQGGSLMNPGMSIPMPGVMPQQPMMPMAPQQPQRIQELMGLRNMDSMSGSLMSGTDGFEVGATKIVVRSVALGATRPQSQQYRRGYDVFADGQTVASICDRILGSSNIHGAITPLSMADMLSDPMHNGGKGVVQYAGGTEASVNIENGWGTDRYRFVIVVDIHRAGRHTQTEIVSGYTDYQAINNAALPNSRSISPQMKFIVNNVSSAAVQTMIGVPGAANQAVMRSSDSVIRNTDYTGPNVNSQQYMTRPMDVAQTCSKLPMYEGLKQASNGFAPAGSFAAGALLDIDTVLGANAKMARTVSNLPSTYSSRLVNGLLSHALPEDDPMKVDGVSAAAVAAAQMREHNFSSQNFINAIRARTRGSILNDATFTYADLLSLDPTIDSRCHVYTKARSMSDNALYVPDGSSVANIAESTPSGMAATMVAQGLAGIMMTAGISLIHLVATNYSGETVVRPTAFDGLDSDGQLHHRVAMLCTRLQLEVFNVITMNNQAGSFMADILADGFNDIYVSMTLNGQKTDFVFPTFASSATSPMVTSDQNKLQSLAKGIQNVVDHVKSFNNTKAEQMRPSFGGPVDY